MHIMHIPGTGKWLEIHRPTIDGKAAAWYDNLYILFRKQEGSGLFENDCKENGL